jgi:hypothetical protein
LFFESGTFFKEVKTLIVKRSIPIDVIVAPTETVAAEIKPFKRRANPISIIGMPMLKRTN